MATIGSDPNGHKRILFVAPDGKRKTVRLGKATMKQATAFKVKVEALIGQTITGVADDEVSRWLAGLDAEMYGRIAAVGLARPRDHHDLTLGALLDGYIAGREADAKPRTIISFDQARKRLAGFFGADKPLSDITEADAEEFYRWMLANGLAVNTARRTCGRAKQFLRFAVRKRLLTVNPFGELKTAVGGNPERKFFLDRATAYRVLDACPDAEWRLLFALSRFGGLRCPSEHLALEWADVDWERSRFRVASPKTEHHEGKAERWVPIFPELRPYLAEAFEQAPDGARFVINRYRDPSSNLRTQLNRIIRRAGLTPWPKLFHNLRATRQTELAECYPIHVVCAWLGNSAAIAREHYLQVTEDHYGKAAREPESTGSSAAQKAAQSAAERGCQCRTAEPGAAKQIPCFQAYSNADNRGQQYQLAAAGLEPTPESSGKQRYSPEQRRRIRRTCDRRHRRSSRSGSAGAESGRPRPARRAASWLDARTRQRKRGIRPAENPLQGCERSACVPV
jgi:integrase